jgi:type II secretory pathway pseudopilin PulG
MRKVSFPLVVLAVVLAVLAAALPMAAQRRGEAKEATQAQADPQASLVNSLVRAANLAMAGEPGVSSFQFDPAAEEPVTPDPGKTVAIEVMPDFLKASDQKIYVPFTATVQAGALGPSPNLAVYLRLTPQGAMPPGEVDAPAESAAKGKADRKKRGQGKEAQDLTSQAVSGVEYPWEDLYELTAAPLVPGGPLAFSRPFSVPAGEYDMYLAIRPREAPAEGAVPIAVLKRSVTVPDYWSTEFTTSSVLLSSQVTPLDRVPTGDEQKTKPYVIGNLELQPKFDGTFTPADELAVFFVIYNPALDAGRKPDVTVEWQPYKKGPVGESKFRAVEPQLLNPQTLPPGFDVDQGHQLVGSLNLPVSAFEPGDYRLAIKVTDNNSGKTLEHEVNFVVTAS